MPSGMKVIPKTHHESPPDKDRRDPMLPMGKQDTWPFA